MENQYNYEFNASDLYQSSLSLGTSSPYNNINNNQGALPFYATNYNSMAQMAPTCYNTNPYQFYNFTDYNQDRSNFNTSDSSANISNSSYLNNYAIFCDFLRF